ncbi:phasin family protein [Candidatus Methanoperedens nitratireducens]|uniref:Polyhydroxyalkanoate synthesis regulator phasin n=1 Tax=Candidatus Methanoperedens nitratireducens TaxID=1392998 RepID=A0A284VMM9_9EURY|nr:hypothetical protein [Candidatus Methanoperedens nitroreducens]SNQ60514.1 conserved hypothetical protein [Candidatus Methanoperedens nitroreducens]
MSEMSEMLRKMGLFGIGVISLTQEKAEEFTQEMIKKGEMSREEGKKFVRDVLSEQDKQLKDIENKINQTIRESLEKSGVAMREDLEAFEKKRVEVLEKNAEMRTNLDRLEKRLEILEKNTVMRVDVDVLEKRIKELEQIKQPMTE